MRVLVTGSRSWKDRQAVFDALDELSMSNQLTVVHGACREGPDLYAAQWCARRTLKFRRDIEEPHPALWRSNGHYDARAGFKRNAAMVELGADICLAFLGPCIKEGCKIQPVPHYSHGASHCARLAEIAGITTYRFTKQRGGQRALV